MTYLLMGYKVHNITHIVFLPKNANLNITKNKNRNMGMMDETQ